MANNNEMQRAISMLENAATIVRQQLDSPNSVSVAVAGAGTSTGPPASHGIRNGRFVPSNIQQREINLIKGLFPKWKDLDIPAELIISKVKCDQVHPIVEIVKEFILEKCCAGDMTRKLLVAWTGWPDIPEDVLKLTIGETDDQFVVHTCFQEVVVPKHYQKLDVFTAMDLLMENYTGFGLI